MSRRAFIATLVILVSLPVALTLADAVSFHAANRNNGSIVSSGLKRQYIVYVPRRYDRSKPTSLIISLHGAGGWPAQQRDLSEWNALADREGVIVVYPSGMDNPAARVWHVDRGPGLMRDVKFISQLIDKLESEYNIDPARIYVNGMSNGGGMTFALSCTLSDRIAAVGMVGSAQTLPWSWCKDRKPVPVIAFHGTADPMAPYEGGASWVVDHPFPGVERWIANWARRNGCDATPVETAAAADVVRRQYVHCAGNADVVLFSIRGGGHTWPGGQQLPEWFAGGTTRSISATDQMWMFFREHPLAR